MSHRDKKLLYHLTSLNNLQHIQAYGLLSRRALEERGLVFVDVADSEILSHRSLYGLDDMVPFHFLTRNPFDYAVVRNRATERFAILAFYRSEAARLGWKITPRHPLTDNEAPDILDWQEGMDQIDWSQMDRPDRNYESDHDCKMVCMAEALSPTAVEFASIRFIYVPSEGTQQEAQRLLAGGWCPQISVNPGMFPNGSR